MLIVIQKRTQFTFDACTRVLSICQKGVFAGRNLKVRFDDISNIVLQTDEAWNDLRCDVAGEFSTLSVGSALLAPNSMA